MEEIKVTIDGKSHVVNVEESNNSIKVHLDGKVYEVETSLNNLQKEYDLGNNESESGSGSIKAAIPGVIFTVDVKIGDTVKKNQKIISLLAMKMENQIKSPIDGKVKKINVKKDDKVNKGDTLMVIE